MIFKFFNRIYDVPDDAGISIEVTETTEMIDGQRHAHLDFNFVKDGDHIPMLGGWDEQGNEVESWADLGIRRIS